MVTTPEPNWISGSPNTASSDGHRQVAHHHEVAPAAQAVPVDLGDHRLRVVEQLEHAVDVVGQRVAPGGHVGALELLGPRRGRSRRRTSGRRRASTSDPDRRVRRRPRRGRATSGLDSSSVIAFSLSGRFSVSRRTGPRSSDRSTGSVPERGPSRRRPRDDQGVDGDAARSGRRSSGLTSSASSRSPSSSARTESRAIADATDRRSAGGAPRTPSRTGRTASRSSIRVARGLVDRRQPEPPIAAAPRPARRRRPP